MNRFLDFYLKWINPLIALTILLICTWIYFGGYFFQFGGGETPFVKGAVIIDPDDFTLSMYFFAKGLFCSSLLFLFGEFMKRYIKN